MDFYSGNTQLFANVIFLLSQKYILEFKKEKEDEFAEVMGNIFFDRDGPKVMEKTKLGKEDELLSKLFKTFSEIAASYESMQNIPIYINSFPFKKSGITKYSYFRYHIEGYLHELYIYEQRLKTYLTIIQRIYRNSKIKSEVDDTARELKEIVSRSLNNPIKVRGAHVHVSRYTDKELDRLSLFDTLSRSPDKEFVQKLELLYKLAYRDTRKKWKDRINNNLKEISKLNDKYFGSLYKTITKNDVLIFPWSK